MAGEPRFAVLAKVEHNWHVLKECDEEFRSDKEIVLIAVEQSDYAFKLAADELKRDRDTVLEAVQINWSCLRYAADELKEDREIVLKAMEKEMEVIEMETCRSLRRSSGVLMLASEKIRADREFMLTVMDLDGYLLRYAAEKLRGDPAIVLQACSRSFQPLIYATNELLLDTTFAQDAKSHGYILKIHMLSGRYVCAFLPREGHSLIVDSYEAVTTHRVIRWACQVLDLNRTGYETLVHGTESIPFVEPVHNWPGVVEGRVTELLLIVNET
eukprot:6491075-Amphidinium_carterae.1